MARKLPIWERDPGLSQDVLTSRWGLGARTVRSGGKFTVKPGRALTVRDRTPDALLGEDTRFYRSRPRVNPADFIVTPGRFGGFITAPRTELTGLDSQTKRDVRAFDDVTARQGERIGGAYQRYATDAAADADATAKRLEGLARLSGTGYSASDPTAAVLSDAARTAAASDAALTTFTAGQLPTLARAQGITAQEGYRADRAEGRTDLIEGFRERNAEAIAANNEDAFKRSQLEATLAIASGEQANTRRGQTLDFRTASADREAALATDIAEMETDLRIAREKNQTTRAVAIEKRLSKKREAQAKARRTNAKVRGQANRLVDQMLSGFDDPETGERLSFTRDDIIDELISQFDLSPEVAARYVSRGSVRSVPGRFGRIF